MTATSPHAVALRRMTTYWTAQVTYVATTGGIPAPLVTRQGVSRSHSSRCASSTSRVGNGPRPQHAEGSASRYGTTRVEPTHTRHRAAIIFHSRPRR